jgi:peptidyl-tRNA hydrolase
MLGAQICHAAGESSPGNLASGTFAVVLAADQQRLKSLAHQLEESGVEHRVIVENSGDLAGQVTAIGVVPKRRSAIKKWFSNLPLLR